MFIIIGRRFASYQYRLAKALGRASSHSREIFVAPWHLWIDEIVRVIPKQRRYTEVRKKMSDNVQSC